MILHPSEYRLNQFADGELSRRLRIRTAAHLEGCSRCRNTIVAIRRLGREARVLPSPSAPPGLKDRILERLANGERVILPVADPPMPAPRGRRVAAAFAATVAIAIAASIITAPTLESESSELLYLPQTPEMGQELSIEYRSTSRFSREDTLVLRGVFRTEELGNTWHDDVPPVTVATLVREGDGVFRTTFRLPEDVVYTVLVVEDVNGRYVDSRGLQFWEVLAHEDGTHTYAALRQKYHDLVLRNWEAARQTAQRITELYPDKPGGWVALSALEYQFYGPSGFALLGEPDHLGEFERLERLLERSEEYSHDDIADMYLYAGVLGDSAGSRRWGDRLTQEAPGHRTAKEIRVSDIVRHAAEGAALASVLEQFENLWEERGLVSTLPEEAFRIALQTDDIDAMGRWLDRLEQAWPSTIDARAAEFAVATAGREAAVQRIRSLLARLEDPDQVNRSLYRTANEQSRHSALRQQALAGVLGQVLIEQGKITDGLGYLIPALDGGWNVELFSSAAEIHLRMADPSEAFALLARVAVDPWTDRSLIDSIGTEARKAVGADQWQAMLENARDAMTEYFLEDLSPQRRINSDIVVRDNAGAPHTIDELIGGKTTLLAFWSRNDFFAVDQLERLGEASRRVEALDGKVIAFVREPPSSEWDEFAQSKELQFPVYHDVESALVRELDVWGYQYFVVDGSGMVKFSYTDLDRALNQMAALRHREKAVTPVSEDGDRLP